MREQWQQTDSLQTRQRLAEQIKDTKEIIAKNQELLTEYSNARASLDKTKEVYDDVIGSAEGLRLANEALNDLYQQQLDKQAAQLGMLQNIGRQLVANVNANPGFYDPRGPEYGSAGSGRADYVHHNAGLQDVIMPPNPSTTSGGGSGSSSQVSKQIEEVNKLLEEAAAAADFFGESFNKSVGSLASTALDDFISALWEGQLTFKEFAHSVFNQLGKLITRALALNLLFQGLGITAGAPTNGFQEMIHHVTGVPFAKGGVVNTPTMFPMGGGQTGIMGEAGAEVIAPLKRDSSGNMGVGAVAPVVNIYNNAGVDVETSRNPAGELDVVLKAVRNEFSRSMSSGQGVYARALESGYRATRRVK